MPYDQGRHLLSQLVLEINVSTHDKKIRGVSRRLADKDLQVQHEKYSRLIQAGQTITSELNLDALFDVISDQTGKILDVERCSIFLIDEHEQNLCSLVPADMKFDQIQFSTDQGHRRMGILQHPPRS
jgi:hypothetical protein